MKSIIKHKYQIWDKPPVSFVIEFEDNATPEQIKKELADFNIIEQVKRVYIISEKE